MGGHKHVGSPREIGHHRFIKSCWRARASWRRRLRRAEVFEGGGWPWGLASGLVSVLVAGVPGLGTGAGGGWGVEILAGLNIWAVGLLAALRPKLGWLSAGESEYISD